jgi:hypothetical protein
MLCLSYSDTLSHVARFLICLVLHCTASPPNCSYAAEREKLALERQQLEESKREFEAQMRNGGHAMVLDPIAGQLQHTLHRAQ